MIKVQILRRLGGQHIANQIYLTVLDMICLHIKILRTEKKIQKKFQNFEYFPVSSELFLKWPLHPTLELKV